MARSHAVRADAAAAALDAFLTTRGGGGIRPMPPCLGEAAGVGESDKLAAGSDAAAGPAHDAEWLQSGSEPPLASQPRGESTSASRLPGTQPAKLRPRAVDWLEHRLTVSGPALALEDFRRTAAGAGIVPWAIDFAEVEEDWFHRLMSPGERTLSAAGARVLAGQLREAAERRHGIAGARVGRSRACPFDLNALVPVPDSVRLLGPGHPDALDWLQEHWGVTDTLRHVAIDPAAAAAAAGRASPAAQEAAMHLRFWAADWTPWAALARIRLDWPALRLDARPIYDLA